MFSNATATDTEILTIGTTNTMFLCIACVDACADHI